MDEILLDAADEMFDVSDAGVPTLTGAQVTITEFEIVEKETGVLHQLTFVVDGLDFPITKGYWVQHQNDRATQAGRGQLKRIALAATGQPKYSRTSLIGKRLVADVGEDREGFAEIKRFRQAS